MRVQWLRSALVAEPAPAVADALELLLKLSESGNASAREVVTSLVFLVVQQAEPTLTSSLRLCSVERDLRSLRRLLEQGPQPVLQARPFTEQPVPDYGRGRELTLGERRTLARRPSRKDFERLLRDPHPMVISLILGNPRAVEDDIVRLATIRPARTELLKEIAKRTMWMQRARVRRCFLHNPGTPPELAVPLLYLCTRQELLELVTASYVQKVVRRCALELCEQRAPLPHFVRVFEEIQ